MAVSDFHTELQGLGGLNAEGVYIFVVIIAFAFLSHR